MSNLTLERLAVYDSDRLELTAANEILTSAELKYKSRDYLGALADYSQAIEIDPSQPKAYCGRGLTFYRLGDITNAEIDFNRAIEIAPKFALAYYRRGALYHVTKDCTRAIADYNKAIDLSPTFALAYAHRGDAYRELYGNREGLIDWRFAAKLFNEQGNIKKYEEMMDLIDRYGDDDTCASGML